MGGLLFSQLITLYLTPVIYTYLARLHGVQHPAASQEPVYTAGD